jgi:hypothetical protein
MDFLYRLLGVAARLNESGSRIRVNFIPINLAVMFLLAVGTFALTGGALEGWSNGLSPRQARITDVLAHRDMDRNYVTVTGTLIPGAPITETRGLEGSVVRTWLPLMDATGKKGLLVEARNPPGSQEKPRIVDVTGMLHGMEGDLRRELEGHPMAPIKIDLEYVLEEGERPGNPLLLSAGAVLVGGLFLLGAVSLALRYVIFRKTGEANLLSGGPLPERMDLRLSACLTLGKHRCRFLDMPAGTGITESGERLFVSNIDASSRFFGVTTSERRGYWTTGIQPGSLDRVEPGFLYLGTARRPALRIRYRDVHTGRTAFAVLSFGTDEERAAMYRDLTASAPMPAVI